MLGAGRKEQGARGRILNEITTAGVKEFKLTDTYI